ncbi:mannosyl-3-phosphoglycerate phosphatase [Thermococcus sp.]|uniref:mannosyl-3-phosphoglycerate phosphatase n=1 Tax=Thermococcus sp. TaxID=35749 RepID=UPI0026228451|nr:mannosyl-3-phosphoglycerate phosphatase [Thermococcus sp.]
MRVIFLDLDKTLLWEDYSPEPAREFIGSLKEKGFEIVLNSSKTRAEQEYYRRAWKLREPFIVENGSAVFIPDGYFPFEVKGVRKGSYTVIELGERYEKIKAILDNIAEKYGLKYYGNSTPEEVMAFTGLPEELVLLAFQREYSETIFRWSREGFEEELEAKGLRAVRGSRFVNVIGNTDKGKAALVILSLYSRLGKVESYAVGDGENDFPLFEIVDRAFIVGNLSHAKAKNISSIDELLEVMG